ncbi:MAG: hypothetical protein ACRDTK_01700, partial [Mycobacterium sp.]
MQWGSGGTGSVALQAIVESAHLELVGLWVGRAEKRGRDAGELVGLAPTGVIATGDSDVLLSLQPDCVCYMGTDRDGEDAVVGDVCGMLAAGVNVVMSSFPLLVHPSGAGEAVRQRIGRACMEGSSSFLCTGIEPGFMADALVLHLSSLSREITSVRVQEAMNVGSYRVPRWRSGLGWPASEDAERYVPGRIARSWTGVMLMLAEGLGVRLDRIYELRNVATAGRAFEVPAGSYGPDDIAALHFTVIGEVGGEPFLTVEHCYRLTEEAGPDMPSPAEPGRRTTRIRIAGR